jgi:hypothetical protein
MKSRFKKNRGIEWWATSGLLIKSTKQISTTRKGWAKWVMLGNRYRLGSGLAQIIAQWTTRLRWHLNVQRSVYWKEWWNPAAVYYAIGFYTWDIYQLAIIRSTCVRSHLPVEEQMWSFEDWLLSNSACSCTVPCVFIASWFFTFGRQSCHLLMRSMSVKLSTTYMYLLGSVEHFCVCKCNIFHLLTSKPCPNLWECYSCDF